MQLPGMASKIIEVYLPAGRFLQEDGPVPAGGGNKPGRKGNFIAGFLYLKQDSMPVSRGE